VTPILPIGLGLAMLAVAVAVLLGFGRRYRVGRLLATVPQVTIAEATRIARAGEARFVRIEGRIDSDREFEDADHRPLVLRRTRFEARTTSWPYRWRTFDLQIEAVPFELHEGLDGVAIDETALSDGLVVVPRRSVGTVGDLGERASAGLPVDHPARMTIEQVSSIEHAIVLGVPVVGRSGLVTLSAGMGRPLVLTTLEVPEAMRILTGGAVARSRIAAACLGVGAGLVVIGALWWLLATLFAPPAAMAASAVPSILPGADTRSAGQGPGLVGDPALALLGVLAIGLAAVLATLVYVRLTVRPPGR
jgi:hypothetical protein